MTRLQKGHMNTLLACLVNTEVRISLPGWKWTQGTCIVANFYEYLCSQVSANIHQYLKDPFSKRMGGGYSTSTSTFNKAKSYIEAVCRDTALQNDEEYRQAFEHCLKIFIVEMLSAQLVMYQIEKPEETPVTRILGTLPNLFIHQMELKPFDGTVDELLARKGEVVLVRDFNEVYEAKAKDHVEDVFNCIIGLGPYVLQNIDFRSLMEEALTDPCPMMRETIAQLWLITQNIYAFGGSNDSSLNYL